MCKASAMQFYEKLSNSKYLLRIRVKPNSKSVRIINNHEFITVLVRSKAIQNKANIELINLLKHKLKLTSNNIKIISGLKSSNKIVQIEFNENMESNVFEDRLLK
ncbi:MAG: DUF167 domain-containing protein [Promethearchaeota archaeon]